MPAGELAWPLPTGGYFLDDGAIMGQQPSALLPTGGYFLDDGAMGQQPSALLAAHGAGALNVDTLVLGGNSFDGTSALEPFFPASYNLSWPPRNNKSVASHALP